MSEIIDKTIFGIILGLFLVGVEIPESLMEVFYKTNLKPSSPSLSLIYASLKNAPNLKDSVLRSMIIKSL